MHKKEERPCLKFDGNAIKQAAFFYWYRTEKGFHIAETPDLTRYELRSNPFVVPKGEQCGQQDSDLFVGKGI